MLIRDLLEHRGARALVAPGEGAIVWTNNIKLPVVKILVAAIETNEPREKVFGDQASEESIAIVSGLVTSIRRGQDIDPVFVRRQVPKDGKFYQLIDGHHRLEAHRQAKQKYILAIVIPRGDTTSDEEKWKSLGMKLP